MNIDRRQFLTTSSGMLLVGCRGTLPPSSTPEPQRLDLLLAAHATARPEKGGGANHYPMAAEALETLGYAHAIAADWIAGAVHYAGEPNLSTPIHGEREALGRFKRYDDWLSYFRDQLEVASWRAVVATWVPNLAPGFAAAAFHGVIRTGHAVRALRRVETDARLGELAIALAYWAARYVELPTTEFVLSQPTVLHTLESVEHPWLQDAADVDFGDVVLRLTDTSNPVAPRIDPATITAPAEELELLVRDAATGVLEMLVSKRHRLWLMHTVTAPAAALLILPELDAADARTLVAYAKQSVIAMFAAYGAPFEARRSLRAAPASWAHLKEQAVSSGFVHTIKLAEALDRVERERDVLCRSVLEQWLEWV